MESIEQKPIRVALVDDDKITREGVKMLLASSDLFQVVGEAEDGFEGIELVKSTMPDVVLFDIQMPIMDGRAFLTVLQKDHPNLKKVVLTSNRHSLYLQMFLHLKVNGYLHKSCGEAELQDALVNIMNGSIHISTKLDDDPTDSKGTKKVIENKVKNLTPQERRVLQALLMEGGTYDHLAEYLGCSSKSVSFHLSNVYKKLEVNNRSALIRDTTKWMMVLSIYPDAELE